MWPLIARQLAKSAGRRLAGEFFGRELNRDEAYVDHIKREFNLRDYHQARVIYDSNRAYWEQLYGDDPLNSRNHPASAPSSLVPRQTPAGDLRYNLFDPLPMGSHTSGPFSSGGQFVPGATAPSSPSEGPMPPGNVDESKPLRCLGARIGDKAPATAFDVGASAVPFVSPSSIPAPGRPTTFDERYPTSVSPTRAPQGAAWPDDLEAFRRKWLKSFMEP